MKSNCQELSESNVKIVLVNNSTTPVFLSLLPVPYKSELKMFDSNGKGFHGALKASHC